VDEVNIATDTNYVFIIFLFDLVVITWIFKIIRCGNVVIIYFRCDGPVAPNSGVNDIDDVDCSYKHHKYNNGDKSYFAKFHGLFPFII
jgi:hypothetical protein